MRSVWDVLSTENEWSPKNISLFWSKCCLGALWRPQLGGSFVYRPWARQTHPENPENPENHQFGSDFIDFGEGRRDFPKNSFFTDSLFQVSGFIARDANYRDSMALGDAKNVSERIFEILLGFRETVTERWKPDEKPWFWVKFGRFLWFFDFCRYFGGDI